MTFQLAAEPLVVRNLLALPDWEGSDDIPVKAEPSPSGASTSEPIARPKLVLAAPAELAPVPP